MKKISLLGAMLLLVAAHYGNAQSPQNVIVEWKKSGYTKSFPAGTTLGRVRQSFEDALDFPAKYMSISGQTKSGDNAILQADKPGKMVKVESTYMGKFWAHKKSKTADEKADMLKNKTQPYTPKF